jgi:hypothetical protein
MAALLAAAPSSGRILRPLCHMLGLPAAEAPKALGRPAAGSSGRPAAEAPKAPLAPAPAAPRQPHPPPPARLPEPPCPRARWPWILRPAAKPA